jgi:hypothetical protein
LPLIEVTCPNTGDVIEVVIPPSVLLLNAFKN